jgi:glycopeptide antibiotics resistance protein
MQIVNDFLKWFESTHLQQQIAEVDYIALFTNPWFFVPFGILIAYLVYKQSWKDLVIIALLVGVWWVSGTPYMATLIVNGEVQIAKILPVVFGGAAALGLVIYLLFGRSD